MLSSIPTELQSQIFSDLSSKDLLFVARLSRRLYAVAVRLLYLNVELKSWTQLDSFFLPPLGSAGAVKHAESRRKQWKTIRNLTIDLSRSLPAPDPSVARSLRDRDFETLQIERLRVGGDIVGLLPLLKWLDPERIVIFQPYERSGGLRSLDGLGGTWKRLREVTFSQRVSLFNAFAYRFVGDSPVSEVTSVTIVLEHHQWTQDGGTESQIISFVLLRFPSLQHLRVVVRDQERKSKLQALFKHGFGGKEATLFSVELADFSRFGFDH